jgi:hypothetical protein
MKLPGHGVEEGVRRVKGKEWGWGRNRWRERSRSRGWKRVWDRARVRGRDGDSWWWRYSDRVRGRCMGRGNVEGHEQKQGQTCDSHGSPLNHSKMLHYTKQVFSHRMVRSVSLY